MTDRFPLVRSGGKNVQIPAGDVLRLRGPVSEANIVAVTTPASENINAAVVASNTYSVTGSGAISYLNNSSQTGAIRRMIFNTTGITLRHLGGNLKLPGGAAIVTQAGDVAEFVQDTNTTWRCTSYTRVDGTTLAGDPTRVAKAGDKMTGTLTLADQVVVTAGATTPLATGANSNFVQVDGTATIGNFGDAPAGTLKIVVFTNSGSILKQDPGGTLLTLPTSADITVQAGDCLIAACPLPNQWRVRFYQRKDGTSLVGGAGTGDFKKDGTVQMTGPFNQASPYTFATGNPSGSGILDWTPATSDFGIVLSGNISSMTGAPTGARRTLVFAAGTVLTHAASILELPGNIDRTTALGDRAEFINRGSSRWQCLWYTKADGTALVAGASFSEAQVRATPMTGVVFTDKTPVVAADTLLAAVGKLQAQLSTGVFRTETIATTSVGQTSYAVPNGYTVGSIVAFFNGVLLAPADYTATDGTNIVLASGALTTSDIMSVLVIGSVRAQDDALLQYTVAALPAASANAFKQRWCTNMAGGAGVVVSNGTNWLRVADNTVVTT